MAALTGEDVLGALRGVTLSGGGDVVSAGMISGVSLRGGRVGFLITIATGERDRLGWLQGACERAVKKLPGVSEVTAVLTAEASAETPAAARVAPARRAVWNEAPLAHVARIVAVASGKGGVGKSTTAVNLAHAFARGGKRVGLLDADIHGPSLPRMLGAAGRPQVGEGKILPLQAHGIACMSMGLLAEGGGAIVWRGPQLAKALHQMLRGVAWGSAAAPLDLLLIDMPPGTGDIHLSLVQQAPVDGAVIVTTPQEVAVEDARKCLDMFRKLGVRLLGVLENMSYFADPSGARHALFGEGGGRRLAESEAVPYLGAIPLDIKLREAADAGTRYDDRDGLYASVAEKLL